MNRPLPDEYLEYTKRDAYLIYSLYNAFSRAGYLSLITVKQSMRYIHLHRRSPPHRDNIYDSPRCSRSESSEKAQSTALRGRAWGATARYIHLSPSSPVASPTRPSSSLVVWSTPFSTHALAQAGQTPCFHAVKLRIKHHTSTWVHRMPLA